MRTSPPFVLALCSLLSGGACQKTLDPVDVSDVLTACEQKVDNNVGTQIECNEEITATASDVPMFGDKAAIKDALVAGVKKNSNASNVEVSEGSVLIQGEPTAATMLALRIEEVDYAGSIVLRGSKLSMCIASTEMKDPATACLRVHAAVLRDGRELLRARVEASHALPKITAPQTPDGCDLTDGLRGTFRIECDEAVVDVSRPEDDVAEALNDAKDDAIADAWDDDDPSVDVADATCTVLGQTVPCVAVVGSWTVRVAVVQTSMGRRLVECGVAGSAEPKGDLCPRIVSTSSHHGLERPKAAGP